MAIDTSELNRSLVTLEDLLRTQVKGRSVYLFSNLSAATNTSGGGVNHAFPWYPATTPVNGVSPYVPCDRYSAVAFSLIGPSTGTLDLVVLQADSPNGPWIAVPDTSGNTHNYNGVWQGVAGGTAFVANVGKAFCAVEVYGVNSNPTNGTWALLGTPLTPSGNTLMTVNATANQNLSEVGGTTITLGQKAMASSLPVVIASDQSKLTAQGGAGAGQALADRPLDTGGSDGTNIQHVGVTASHAGDRQIIPGGTNWGWLVNGFGQIVSFDGFSDRQHETAFDNQSATGIVEAANQFLFQGMTTDATDNFAAGTRTFTPVAMTGTLAGISWSIQVGSPLILDSGGNQEQVIVTAVTGTTFTCVTTKAHNGTVTPFTIVVNAYNQERDAAGELDAASGAGTAVAAAYEYSGGASLGGTTTGYNFDRVRNLQGKGLTTGTISSGGGVGSSSIVLTAPATGLQAGQLLLLTGGTSEWVRVAKNYANNSATIPIEGTIQNASHTGVSYSAFAVGGPGLNTFLPDGEGTEVEAIYDPTSGNYALTRSASGDAVDAKNIPLEGIGLYNGNALATAIDRLKGGAVANVAAATGYADVLPVGQYNSAAPTVTSGNYNHLQLDVNANLKETLATLIAGEDLTNNVMKVEGQFSSANITTATTTTVKSGAGLLHAIIFNKPVASEVYTIYDNTAASGTKLGTITMPATLLAQGPLAAIYDIKFATGLTIVSAQASDATIAYR